MIQDRAVAVRPGAARVTALVLLAALLRARLGPVGEGPSALIFGASLALILVLEGRMRPSEKPRWGLVRSGLTGCVVGAVLVFPLLLSTAAPFRDPDGFWSWGAATAVIATLEEAVIRGSLFRRWMQEAGPQAAMIASATVFALIHLPTYGPSALPLDFAVGLSLAGVRTISGRVLPCAIAHVLADWGAWFWSAAS